MEQINQELPKGFRVLPSGNLIFDTGAAFETIWERHAFAGGPVLSRGELARVEAMGDCYLTAPVGRIGWNIRKSFPGQYARRNLPFVKISGGVAVKFVPTNRRTHWTGAR